MVADTIQTVMSAADNEIIGRIRIQKIFYLLEELNLIESGFTFSYHHYGPYSEDLSTQLTILSAFSEEITETSGITKAGAKFSIYKLNDAARVENLPDGLHNTVQLLKRPLSVVIELAATIHWLRYKDNVQDWKTELRQRKPHKATDENIRKALELLNSIGIRVN